MTRREGDKATRGKGDAESFALSGARRVALSSASRDRPVGLWLTRAAFFIAIALMLARATMLETLRDPFEATPGADPVPRGFGAAASVVLDWLALVPAILVLARAAIDRSFSLRRSPSLWFAIALAAWAGASAWWANDRFVAVIGSAHFVAGVALLWTMAQTARDWLHLRVVVAAAVALLLVLIASSMIYRFVDLPDTQRTIERDWPKFLEQRGWAADSFMARQFYRKVMAREMVGFSASPNTLAALTVMLSIIAAGAAIQRAADRDAPWWAIAIAAPLPPAAVVLYFTHSKAAFVSPILAAVCIGAVALAGPMLAGPKSARRRAITFGAAIVAILAAAGLLVGYGLTHGNLANDSLNFRWRYWIGSSRLIAQHPVLGVGWNNFGDQYLAFREPVASEEIKDPHNIFVRIVAELGFVGGALLIGWLATFWWEITKPAAPMTADEQRDERRDRPPAALKFITWLAAAAMAANVLCSIDFAQDPGWIFLEAIKPALYFALIVMAMIVVSFRSTSVQDLDRRPARWMRVALIVGLGMFLLHNTIDFSLFESGPMWAWMVLGGSALGMAMQDSALRDDTAGDNAPRESAPRTHSRATPTFSRICLVVTSIAWIGAGVALVLPIVIAESKAQASDDALRARDLPRASELAHGAFDALPFANSDYLYRAARASPPDESRALLREAIRINPTSGQYYRTLAAIEKASPSPDVKALRDAFDHAVALDPNDVHLRIDYAETLERLGLNDDARQQYRIALQKNDLLDPAEPKRLPPQRVQEVQDRVDRIGT